jgi:hypothetical protein
MMPFFIHQVINNAPPSDQFLLALKKVSGMGKTKYFVGSICSLLKKKKKKRDFVETSKEKSSMNYFMHSIYLSAYFYKFCLII